MKRSSRIAAGVAGAAGGYLATFVLYSVLDLGNRSDPIASGLAALFIFAPVGAIAGLVIASRLAMRGDDSGSLARNSLTSLAVAVVLCLAAGAAYGIYAYATATPWLNPNGGNPLLVFEVRFPPGVAVPVSSQAIVIELQTDLNTMPGELTPARFHADGEQSVIAGEVELAFRTSHRQLAVDIKGQPSRIYPIELTAKAPHAAEFGPWQRIADGSEIRYRAKWPGKT